MEIGIDVGGTKMNGIVLSNGTILSQHKIATPQQPGPFVAAICSLIDEILQTRQKIKGIGICFPGAVNREKGSVISMPSLPHIHNIEIKKILTKKYSLPVIIENDGKCAAIAEFLHGAGKGKQTIVALTIGTGIGGGIIANGQLCIGRGNGGEVGHLTMEPNGVKCACGRYGCWEEYGASRGVMRMAKSAGLKGNNPLDIENLARAKNQKAQKIYDTVGYYLGIGIADLIKVFDPEMVTLSGSITNALDLYAAGMNKEIDRRVFFNHCPVKLSKIKHAPSVGAASLFEFYENSSRTRKR